MVSAPKRGDKEFSRERVTCFPGIFGCYETLQWTTEAPCRSGVDLLQTYM